MKREKKRHLLVTGPDRWGCMYVYLREQKIGDVAKYARVNATVDYDKDGKLIGVEIFRAYATRLK